MKFGEILSFSAPGRQPLFCARYLLGFVGHFRQNTKIQLNFTKFNEICLFFVKFRIFSFFAFWRISAKKATAYSCTRRRAEEIFSDRPHYNAGAWPWDSPNLSREGWLRPPHSNESISRSKWIRFRTRMNPFRARN